MLAMNRSRPGQAQITIADDSSTWVCRHYAGALELWIVLTMDSVPPLACEAGGGLSELNQGVTQLICGLIVTRV